MAQGCRQQCVERNAVREVLHLVNCEWIAGRSIVTGFRTHCCYLIVGKLVVAGFRVYHHYWIAGRLVVAGLKTLCGHCIAGRWIIAGLHSIARPALSEHTGHSWINNCCPSACCRLLDLVLKTFTPKPLLHIGIFC